MLTKLISLLFVMLLLSSKALAVEVTAPVGDRCSEMFNYKGEVYVCADHPVYGKELHRINGGRYSTVVVKDIDPGPGGSGPRAFFESNGWLYFFAETTATGYAIWRTNGTEGGTKLVRSIGNFPDRVVTSIDGEFFIINKDSSQSSNGNLIRTDGTYQGTRIVESVIRSRQVYSSQGIRQIESTFVSFGGYLYFITNNTLFKVGDDDSVSVVYENLPAVSNQLSQNLLIARITGEVFNTQIVIEGVGSRSQNSQEIWLSDGTSGGSAVFIKDNGASVRDPRIINDRLVYSSGSNLLSTNGEDTVELYSGGGVFYASSAGSRLIYGLRGLFRIYGYIFTDGTIAGTKFVELFEQFNAKIYNGFAYYGRKRVITKVEMATGKVEYFQTGRLGPLMSVDSRGVVYETWDIGHNFLDDPYELWLLKPNGASLKLGLVPPSHIHNEGGRVYFVTPYNEEDGFFASGNGIWHSNATAASTYRLYYRYDNGEPEPEPINSGVLVPIVDLLMDEEEKSKHP